MQRAKVKRFFKDEWLLQKLRSLRRKSRTAKRGHKKILWQCKTLEGPDICKCHGGAGQTLLV